MDQKQARRWLQGKLDKKENMKMPRNMSTRVVSSKVGEVSVLFSQLLCYSC
jgi:hypothetical protein